MGKFLKIIISIFVGLDVFVVAYLGLAQLRLMMFGEGQIPGGGSALDMALFLLPLFLAYIVGDRLFYFLTYTERRATRPTAEPPVTAQADPAEAPPAPASQPVGATASVWE